jgi:hypothetical protein
MEKVTRALNSLTGSGNKRARGKEGEDARPQQDGGGKRRIIFRPWDQSSMLSRLGENGPTATTTREADAIDAKWMSCTMLYCEMLFCVAASRCCCCQGIRVRGACCITGAPNSSASSVMQKHTDR